MSVFITSWLAVASDYLETEFGLPVDLLPGAAIPASAASLTLMVDLAGDWIGTFTVTADAAALTALFAEAAGREPERAAPASPEEVETEWQRLFRRICVDASAEVGKKTGKSCEVAMISPESTPVDSTGMGYQMRTGSSVVALVIADLVELAPPEPPRPAQAAPEAALPPLSGMGGFAPPPPPPAAAWDGATTMAEALTAKGMNLLLDVELEASLRFGSRELALSDLLELGPGDVIQLDRALTDPVDLIIGDKIVARGEVVLVNGNFGLQVTEVAEPRKTLETIRCLF